MFPSMVTIDGKNENFYFLIVIVVLPNNKKVYERPEVTKNK